MPNDWSGEGLEKREERAQGSTEEDDVIAGVDRAGEGVLVRVQVVKDAVEEGGWRGILGAVE